MCAAEANTSEKANDCCGKCETETAAFPATESTDPAVATKIQENVASMHKRVEDGRPLLMWDQLYREIFKHADKIKMDFKKTNNGIGVTETFDDS